MTIINVTVDVHDVDLLDALAWHEGAGLGWRDHKFKTRNIRWLTAYQGANGEQREELFASMPTSLGWAVHEVECTLPGRGVDRVREVLDLMEVRCRPLSDPAVDERVYVVCDRLLDPETNEHCEYDGRQDLAANGTWTCPGCKRTNYYSTSTSSSSGAIA